MNEFLAREELLNYDNPDYHTRDYNEDEYAFATPDDLLQEIYEKLENNYLECPSGKREELEILEAFAQIKEKEIEKERESKNERENKNELQQERKEEKERDREEGIEREIEKEKNVNNKEKKKEKNKEHEVDNEEREDSVRRVQMSVEAMLAYEPYKKIEGKYKDKEQKDCEYKIEVSGREEAQNEIAYYINDKYVDKDEFFAKVGTREIADSLNKELSEPDTLAATLVACMEKGTQLDGINPDAKSFSMNFWGEIDNANTIEDLSVIQAKSEIYKDQTEAIKKCEQVNEKEGNSFVRYENSLVLQHFKEISPILDAKENERDSNDVSLDEASSNLSVYEYRDDSVAFREYKEELERDDDEYGERSLF